MISKRNSKELIITSLYELLQTNTIEQISVRDIANNCGVTTRAFYNHFIDKHDAVAQIYISELKPYLQSSLVEWSDHRTALFLDSPAFFRNCIQYTGQNNLMDVIIQMEKEKYAMHIKREVDTVPSLRRLIVRGISYFIYGNIGMLKESYGGNIIITEEEYAQNYQNTWELMSVWVPQIVRDNLSVLPVREPSQALLKMIKG